MREGLPNKALWWPSQKTGASAWSIAQEPLRHQEPCEQIAGQACFYYSPSALWLGDSSVCAWGHICHVLGDVR